MLCLRRYHTLDVETEVDPLEERLRDGQVGESLEDLLMRVNQLEERVGELICLEEGIESGRPVRTKKKRRRFLEMRREFQVVPSLSSANTAPGSMAPRLP